MSDIGRNEAMLVFRFGVVLDSEGPRLFWIMVIVAPFGLISPQDLLEINPLLEKI